MKLSSDQQQALDKFVAWKEGTYVSTNKDNKVFVLSGPAGTGKSFLIDKMIRSTDLKRVAYVTFTGKAALVLQRNGLPATTIHKLIYQLDEENKNKMKFVLKDSLDVNYDLIVIDEISMVSEEILRDIRSFGVKLLASGDSHQLEPVQGTLNKLLRNADAELTTVHRQALENPIIAYATRIRLERPTNPIPAILKLNGKTAVWVGRNNSLSDSEYDRLLLNSLKDNNQILCGTHATRNMINNRTRMLKGIDTAKNPLPIAGDKLVCRRNAWNKPLDNAEIRTKLEIGLDLGIFGESSSYDFHSLNPELTGTDDLSFYRLPLINGTIGYALNDVVKTRSHKKFGTELFLGATKSLKDVYSYNLDFRPDFVKYPIEYFEGLDLDLPFFFNNDEDTLLRLIEEDNIDVEKEQLSEGYKFQFGNAITVHSSQGSSFEKVLVISERFGDPDIYYKWLYTAITRAVSALVVLY